MGKFVFDNHGIGIIVSSRTGNAWKRAEIFDLGGNIGHIAVSEVFPRNYGAQFLGYGREIALVSSREMGEIENVRAAGSGKVEGELDDYWFIREDTLAMTIARVKRILDLDE